MKVDAKKIMPVALIALGVVLAYVNLNQFITGIGAIMLIVGIAWIVIAKKKKKPGEYKGAYIANPDTKVFHYPDCPALEKIAPIPGRQFLRSWHCASLLYGSHFLHGLYPS